MSAFVLVTRGKVPSLNVSACVALLQINLYQEVKFHSHVSVHTVIKQKMIYCNIKHSQLQSTYFLH